MAQAPFYSKLFSPVGSSALILAPHPDDEVLGCGGALMLHLKNNDPVKVLVLTNGEKGDFLRKYADRKEYISLREKESLKAAKIMGLSADRISFLGYPDQKLRHYFDRAKKELLKAIKEISPKIIYAPAPRDPHTDHLFCYKLALWGARKIRDPKSPIRIMGYEIHSPAPVNCYVDISSVADKKFKAMSAFKSQNKVFDYAKGIRGLNEYRALKFSPEKTKAVEAFQLFSSI